MRSIVLLLLIYTFLLSCKSKDKEDSIDFSDSFKELKDSGELEGGIEHLDSVNNIYSNYKYHVSFDGPNNWEFDTGVSEHTIYRTYQSDSIMTFNINVVEFDTDRDEGKLSTWEFYLENKDIMDKSVIDLIEYQKKTKVEDFTSRKTFIKNHEMVRRSFKYLVRDLDFEYYMTHILYQTMTDNTLLSFGLSIPSNIYQTNQDHFEGLFSGVYFLKDTEKLNEIMSKNKKNIK